MRAMKRRLKEDLNAAMIECERAAKQLESFYRDIGMQMQDRGLTDANCLLTSISTKHEWSSGGVCLYCGAIAHK